jgi:hypothetical protein
MSPQIQVRERTSLLPLVSDELGAVWVKFGIAVGRPAFIEFLLIATIDRPPSGNVRKSGLSYFRQRRPQPLGTSVQVD